MSRKQWHIGVQEHKFKRPMQLNYSILVFKDLHFYVMEMFQFD